MSITPTSSHDKHKQVRPSTSPAGTAGAGGFTIPKLTNRQEKDAQREIMLKNKYGDKYVPPGSRSGLHPPKSMLTNAAKAAPSSTTTHSQGGAHGGGRPRQQQQQGPSGPPVQDKTDDMTFLERALEDACSILTMEPSERQLNLLRYGEAEYAAIVAGKKRPRIPLPDLIFVNTGAKLRLNLTKKDFDIIAEYIASEQLKEIMSENPDKVIIDNEYFGIAENKSFRVYSGIFGCKNKESQEWMIRKIAEYRTPEILATRTQVHVPKGTEQAFRAYKKGEHGVGRLMSILVKKAMEKYTEAQLIKVIRVCNPELKGFLKFNSWYSVKHDQGRVAIFETDIAFAAGVKLAEARISLGMGRVDAVFM